MSKMKLRDACLQTLEVTTSPATRDRDDRAFKHVPKTDRGDVVRVAFNIPVPQEGWIDFLTRGADIFGHDYIGYWGFGARPVDRDDLWLVIEHEVLDKLNDDAESGVSARDAFVMEVALIFGSGKKLPKGVHLLDAADSPPAGGARRQHDVARSQRSAGYAPRPSRGGHEPLLRLLAVSAADATDHAAPGSSPR